LSHNSLLVLSLSISVLLSFVTFFFYRSRALCDLHSFPTRRSSDLGSWLWPAIWMMPEASVYGPWPASGEIDIAESRGNSGSSYPDRKSTRLNSSHVEISYAVFCLKKKKYVEIVA